MAPRPTRKLTVTRCEIEREGVSNKTGKPYKIFSVDAVDEHGQPIVHRLKSFAELPLGTLQEYEITVKHDDHWGDQYTIGLKRAPGQGGSGLRSVYERMELLEARVAALENR